ncbi:MAG: HAD-IIB family hydrolase [Lachnospiraceae bacterium]|nr:HAD-IIB family hydrolase [Lachnospiraceae bacterium]
MRKLYVSDLDGTLLNQRGDISVQTAEMLNTCIEEGMAFTINTARTPATVFPIMQSVNMNMPYAMMNGVLIYNPVQQEYMQTHYLTRETAMVVLGIIKLHKLQCFMYTLEQGNLCTYYDSVESHSLNKFRNERIMKYDKVFTEVDDLSICTGKGVIYFCLRERKELLEGLYRDLQAVRGANAVLYEDVYNTEWTYLEIYSDKASKSNALNTIKEWGRFDYMVGFGDSANDKEMFQICDETYAVSNATAEIQDLANGIIPSNEDNGVPRFLSKVLRDSKMGM